VPVGQILAQSSRCLATNCGFYAGMMVIRPPQAGSPSDTTGVARRMGYNKLLLIQSRVPAYPFGAPPSRASVRMRGEQVRCRHAALKSH
jgi:hypothetical protein